MLLVGCGQPQQSSTPAEAYPVGPVAEAKAPDISIHDAAESGNIEAVKQHMAAGTDVTAKNKYGYTPLHKAAFNGHNEIVELLIENSADVNAKDEDETTPLYIAIEEGHTETADLLRKHGGKTGEELKAERK